MTPSYALNGHWSPDQTVLFMKAMFGRQVAYDHIPDESIEFLKDWASLGKPFSDTGYAAIFTAFRESLAADPALFFDGFFTELAAARWPDEKVSILLSTLTHEPVRSGFQVLLMKVIGNLLPEQPLVSEGYDAVKNRKCQLHDIDYFLETYSFFDDRTDLLNKIVNEHHAAAAERSFPDVYVSEKHLRDEEKEGLLIKIDPSVSTLVKSLTLNFAELTTFQELLNTLFNHLLSSKISMYSYGKQWVLSKYDGVYFTDLEKLPDSERRSLAGSGITQETILSVRLLRIGP